MNPRMMRKNHRAFGASSGRTCTAEDVEDTMRVDLNTVADIMEEDAMEEDTREVHHHHHQWRTMKRSPSTEDHQWLNPRDSHSRDATVIMEAEDITLESPDWVRLCALLPTSLLSLFSPLISTSSDASRESKSLLRRSPERRSADGDGKNGRSAAVRSQLSNSQLLFSSQLSSSTLQLSRTQSTLSHPMRRSPRTRRLALSMLQLQPVSDPTRTRWSERSPQ